MKLRWLFLITLTAALIAAEIASTFGVSNRIRSLKELLLESNSTALSLEREIGYGGLIHNFKNYILRPGEEKYFRAARANAEQALLLIDRLEAGAQQLDQQVETSEIRRMVLAYGNRLDTVKAKIETGASPYEIDASVRFNDEDALQEIKTANDIISSNIYDRVDQLESTSRTIQLLIIGCMILIIVSDGVYLNNLTRHNRNMRTANDALSANKASLEKTNTALLQFAGIASHDMKTPVGHILYFCGLIEQDVEKPDDVRKHVSSIQNSARRMQSLVVSLLEFTRSGFSKPKVSTVDIRAIVNDVASELAPEIEKSKAEINITALPNIEADPELVSRVFYNLIQNSLKYAKDDIPPQITIESELRDKDFVFSVSDNGIGIDPKYAEKVFEPMQRLHRRTSKYPGVGIGLSLAKSIIEGHGGNIWLDTSYGNGTRFSFSLPLK